jgi:hypothetical protein
MERREFIKLLGGAAVAGRLRRSRSSPSGYGASEFSRHGPLTMPKEGIA